MGVGLKARHMASRHDGISHKLQDLSELLHLRTLPLGCFGIKKDFTMDCFRLMNLKNTVYSNTLRMTPINISVGYYGYLEEVGDRNT